ncbi:MAG TPA: hypothetical protein VMW24_17085 [Sedimentisphaerales bacterium]|nr:hypothetical protein [Sedimentisphaerales bacterium]
MKTKTELEPKAKHPVLILLLLTFPAIAASIERSQVRLICEFLPLAIETICIFNDRENLCKKNLRQFKQNVNFFLTRDVRDASNTVAQSSAVIKQSDAATKITTAGSHGGAKCAALGAMESSANGRTSLSKFRRNP